MLNGNYGAAFGNEGEEFGDVFCFSNAGGNDILSGINQELSDLNTAQKLLELLELAEQIRQLGGIQRILEENEALRNENDVLRAQLDGVSEGYHTTSGYCPYPQFPQDFYHFTGDEAGRLSDGEIQGLIYEAQTLELAAGLDTYVSAGNVVVYVGRHNGERVTMVAKDFYELIENEEDKSVTRDIYSYKFNI
ncbi:hypothetical protein [Paenibacillus massiliensis]|uniref:hypothetical protein n=1 Tax=Paenibacillus massiliensis TaxID=225917 RepID=UPI00035D7187|nr:hypothetical protein [Paenibacillus massiliensis]